MIHLIDTHCHLTNPRFADDREQVIAGLRAAGIWQVMTIGTGVADARAALALSQAHSGLIACAAGLDPFSCDEAEPHFESELAALEALLRGGGFSALGEIGLEYFHTLRPHSQQIAQFEAQLALATALNLPVVIHVRDAHIDALATLARHHGSRGVIHSFSGDAQTARAYLDLGWHLSFNGMLTYKGNDSLRDAARMVPADRLLVETDAPYLPPVPHRGRRCLPNMTADTCAVLADLRGERDDDVRAWTTRTACTLFGWQLPPEWAAAKPGY